MAVVVVEEVGDWWWYRGCVHGGVQFGLRVARDSSQMMRFSSLTAPIANC